MKDDWLSAELTSAPVRPIMEVIWRDYLAPVHTSVIRFHIDIYAYRLPPLNREEMDINAAAINRLINLCRFARSNQFRMIPVFAGSDKYQQGKEQLFPIKVTRFVQDLLQKLERMGEADLYRQIAAWQIEDEMNHFIRHAGWAEDVYTTMLLTAAESIGNVETELAVEYHAARMVIFPADMMFFKAFLFSPRRYIWSILRDGFYDFQLPSDMRAFLSSPAIDIIGVDMYPGLYSPLATTATFLRLVRCLCERYGLGTTHNKRFMVAEAGYATWPSGRAREVRQLHFYQQMMTGLSDYFWNDGGRERGLLGLIWYCFNDQHIRLLLWPPQEWRFGVVKTVPPNEWYATYPSEPKVAWYWLRDHVQRYVEGGMPCQPEC